MLGIWSGLKTQFFGQDQIWYTSETRIHVLCSRVCKQKGHSTFKTKKTTSHPDMLRTILLEGIDPKVPSNAVLSFIWTWSNTKQGETKQNKERRNSKQESLEFINFTEITYVHLKFLSPIYNP